MLFRSQLGAASARNPLDCPPGRHAGDSLPPWYANVRSLLEANLDAFPFGLDVPFLLAWIEQESDGRHDAASSLGEVGYFQLHPAEIDDMFGRGARDAVIAEIRANPRSSIRAGGALLRHYDEAIVPFRISRRGNLYHGLLKTMHTSRPRGIQWLRHVTSALGRLPRSFDEFLAATVAIKNGQLPSAPGVAVPPLPSCTARQLLQRRNELALPGDGSIDRTLALPFATVAMANTALAIRQPPFGQIGFPGVDFGKPLETVFIVSGWGRPRPARGGVHEGIDMRAAIGTPVFAVEDGIVSQVTTGEFAGRFVSVQHNAGWTSRYMHLSRENVREGQQVSRGDLIALSGDTGIQRSAPHLHFDLLLREDLLRDYVDKFGQPRSGFGTRRGDSVGVPAEPLIPADGYASVVIRDAKANGIPLHDAPFPWTQIAIGAGALALGWYGFVNRERIRRVFV
jgi:murein DD-endopeptidase MepM/ murein hydrolase activator NlpD